MKVTIIQPPLVQLNTPYPSGAYLLSFFNSIKKDYDFIGQTRWIDMSNGLFHQIFSSKGLKTLFEMSEEKALKMASDYESKGDEETAFQIRRYLNLSEAWIFWIDRIVEIVCGGKSAREYCHEFVRSPHVPRGMRMENYLYNLGRDVTCDDAQFLASFALADLADYITMVVDPNFRLISYAEKLGTSEVSFDNVIEGLKSPVLTVFFDKVLSENFCPDEKENELFLISVPFPGCFEAAIYAARWIKNRYGKKALIAMGGGYVNTELRNVQETRLFDYIDFLSYDMGYGSYLELCDKLKENGRSFESVLEGVSMYKNKHRYNGKIIEADESGIISGCSTKNTVAKGGYGLKEEKVCRNLVPDFSAVDFSKYPRLADDVNAMHRIWNDGAWLKSYLAHGCYWHRCAFCDTSLEYVNRYCKCDAERLCNGLLEQAEKTGVYGIHFVDEACPPVSLVEFGMANCRNAIQNHKKLTFWGNIRFEKTFTRDMADFLSYSGLTAVSAGIEIATGEGLDSVNKGTTIENIVKACCAFKEAGILVHSYMIFGFWKQTEQDLVNSMETLRQLFKNGLLDSAFWHKFTLTLHSTVYKEYEEGKHPNLKIVERNPHRFAENDLHFEGEGKSEKYSEGLNLALDSWMHGQKLEMAVNKWFSFNMPRPSIPQNYIEKMIEKYEKERDMCYNQPPLDKEKFVWLGGKPLALGHRLSWSFMGESFEIECNNDKKVVELLGLLSTFDLENMPENVGKQLYELAGKKTFKALRQGGLCKL